MKRLIEPFGYAYGFILSTLRGLSPTLLVQQSGPSGQARKASALSRRGERKDCQSDVGQ